MMCVPLFSDLALAFACKRFFLMSASLESAFGLFASAPALPPEPRLKPAFLSSFLASFSSASSSTTSRPSSEKRRPLLRRASARLVAPAAPTWTPLLLLAAFGRTVSTECAASADMKSKGTSWSSWIQVLVPSLPSRFRFPAFEARFRLAPPPPPPSPSLRSDSASQASSRDCTASCAMTPQVAGSAALPRFLPASCASFATGLAAGRSSSSSSSLFWNFSKLSFCRASSSSISTSLPSLPSPSSSSFLTARVLCGLAFLTMSFCT
mmetsp:Transcript_31431/g.90756  ORF Transcript_31431/g.90756 Transcript_31431/m.90756 type:complete len:266 (-) Transcript_31431:3039-3836(-)